MRNKTIRRLPPIAREIAHLQNDVKSIDRKLTGRIKRIAEMEKDMRITKFHATAFVVPSADSPWYPGAKPFLDELKRLNPAIAFKDYVPPEPLFEEEGT